jgi:hypothetical protein
MSLKLLIVLALGCAAAVPAAAQNRPNEARETMRRMGMKLMSPKKLAKAIARAEKSPLGSKANPVRVNMPEGQIAYLRRLRCADGRAPAFVRQGNVGPGVYRTIVDRYTVTCPDAAPVDAYMDMYHDGPEDRPLPGFTMAPPEAGTEI